MGLSLLFIGKRVCAHIAICGRELECFFSPRTGSVQVFREAHLWRELELDEAEEDSICACFEVCVCVSCRPFTPPPPPTAFYYCDRIQAGEPKSVVGLGAGEITGAGTSSHV